MRRHLNRSAFILAALVLASLSPRAAVGQAATSSQQPTYTLPEYNSLQSAQAEKDPQAQIRQLDSFVQQYPNSTLLQYIYQMYYTAYYKLKNIPKAIEYADKLIALGDSALQLRR